MVNPSTWNSESRQELNIDLYPVFKQAIGGMKNFLSWYGRGLYKRLDKSHAFLSAGGLSFSLFVCLLPMILIIFSILGRILEIPNIRQQIDLFINTAIPYPQASAMVKKIVFDRITEFRLFSSKAGYFGSIGLFLAASGLFSSMRTILNNIFQVSESKHFLIGKLRDFGMILLVIIFFLLSNFLMPLLEIIKDSIGRIDFLAPIDIGFFEKQLISLLAFLIMFAIFYVLYNFITYEKIPRGVIALSAIWAAGLWEIAKQLFGFYLTNFASFKRIYGTYIFIIIIAFWMYYSSLIFIIAAHIGQLFRERPGQKSPDTPVAPDENK